MATQLDLQEQEQVDALKAFWNQYGNLVTWTLILALGAFAAWNGWNWYQRDQAAKASAMHDELERAVQAGDVDKAGRIFGDLRERYARTAFAQQGGLLVAKVQAEKGKPDDAVASLGWVAANAREEEIKTIAQVRLAGLHLDAKKYDDALKALDAAKAPGFEALVADRRGDVLMAQGKRPEAVAAYKAAWAAMPDTVDYRRVIDAKLTSLGAAPAALPASAAAVTPASGAK
jgi:predicted negative regulator of RcsB-dependent stress response